MAVNAKIPVALFSLEMSNVQLVNRMIVNVCEIPGEKIKSGQLAPYEWGQLDYKIKDYTMLRCMWMTHHPCPSLNYAPKHDGLYQATME